MSTEVDEFEELTPITELELSGNESEKDPSLTMSATNKRGRVECKSHLHSTVMAAEVAISLVIRNSLHVLSEGKILSRGLRDQINTATDNLQNKFITLKLLESGSEDDQQSSDRSHLLDRARGALHIADRVLLEASQHLKSHKGRLAKIRALVHFMWLWIRVRATKKMARDFITRVEELSTHLSHMQDQSSHDLRYVAESGSLRNAYRGNVNWNGKVESDIVGRENEVDKLLAWLTLKDVDQGELKLRIVSVVGEEAIGKTALVRSVYNRLEIDHTFQCRVWVHVPEEFTLKDLLVKILKQTPLQELKDLEHTEQENLEGILHKSLMELRYLIVFDNLRKAEDMDELMIILTDSRNGSRVIVTTRDPEIPSLIDPWASPLKLNKLDANQSKRLLGERGSVSNDPGLTARILSKCDGSPLGISLLGGLASGHSSPTIVDQLADNSPLLDIVSLSYRKLPSLLKPCLLYLCLFPKESEISTRRLFWLWLAEGLVRLEHTTAPGGEEQVVRSTAMECFEELVGRNLIHVVRRRKLSGRPKSCRVPSFLHNYLCEMATRFGLLQIHSDTMCTYHSKESKVGNGCSWIVKYQEKNYPQKSQQGDMQPQHLRSYLSFKMRQGTRSREVEELLRPLISKGDSGLLRVLDLEGAYKPSLPEGLGNVLLNLRYLGLRWTVIDSIPESVGNMSRLETLDLKHTNIRKLPSSIWKMESLQHLYMNEVCFDKSTGGGKSGNLQTLWGLYIGSAKSPMLDVLRKLTGLKKLWLTCDSPVMKKATECILELTELESLKLRSRDLFSQPSDLDLSNMTGLNSILDLYLLGSFPKRVSQDVPKGLSQRGGLEVLPRNLKILTLAMSGLDADPMPVLGKLEGLEMLNLFAGSYTGHALDFCISEDPFSRHDVNIYPQLCEDSLSRPHVDSFPRLRILKLWKLGGVKVARVDKTALCRLEELEIKDCRLLTSIASLNHIESLKQIRLIKVMEELAKNIKRKLIGKLFIKGKQSAISPSSQAIFIKEKQLLTSSSSSSAQAAEIN